MEKLNKNFDKYKNIKLFAKSKILVQNLAKIQNSKKPQVLIFKTILDFIYLRQAFHNTLIFKNCNPKYNIQIKSHISNYAINSIQN